MAFNRTVCTSIFVISLIPIVLYGIYAFIIDIPDSGIQCFVISKSNFCLNETEGKDGYNM